MRGKLLKRIRLYSTRPSVVLFFADGATYEISVENHDPRCTSFRAKIELDPRTEDLLQMPRGDSYDERYLETPELDCTISKAVLHKFKDKAMSAYDLDHCYYENVLHDGVAIRLEWEGRAYWCCITAMLEARDKYGRCYERKFNDVYVDRREDGEVAAQRKPLPA